MSINIPTLALAKKFTTDAIESAAVKGEDGKSAYEIWLSLGNTGTEEDFINSLKGKDGASGVEIDDSSISKLKTWSSSKIDNNIDVKVNSKISGDFISETGFGNIRYYAGNFEYYDVNSSSWVDLVFTGDNQYLLNMTPQSMIKMFAKIDIENQCVKLKWEEPNNTIIEGQLACIVEGVKIIRKQGSAPKSENDGELVLDIKAKDFGKYSSTYFIDDGIEFISDETYYYHFYPYSDLGVYNMSDYNQISLIYKDYDLYGFRLDTAESDPSSMITYLADNKNFNSAYMNYTTGTFDSGDWKNAWFMKVKPCMLNYDGTVAYYLNPNDYTLKEDGTASDIADETFEGNAMIGIPKTYWKIVDNNDGTVDVYFSNKAVDEDFHCWSHLDNNGEEIDYCYMPIYNGYSDGDKLRSLSEKTPTYSQNADTEINLAKANNTDDNIIWYTEVYSDRMLINLLLLLIGKSTDTQTVFGNGYYTGGSESSNPRIITGTMNTKGLFWGINDSSMNGVKVFGMEHWWGNQWRRIAGWINDKGNQKVKLTYGQSDGSTVDGYNTDGSGYISIGCTPNGAFRGYISKMTATEYGLIPTTANGSATTYFPDGFLFDNAQTGYPAVGGASGTALPLAGAFYLNFNNLASYSSWDRGAAISCKPPAQKVGD